MNYRNHKTRDVLKSFEYATHVSAMTTEDLYSKSEIAEELAFRDMEIARLTKQRDELVALIRDDSYAISFQSLGQYRSALLAKANGEKS